MANTDTQNERILRKEEERIKRNEARAEAFQENMVKVISYLLKQENIKKALDREAKDAVRNRQNNPFRDQAKFGTYKDDGEVITGLEPRPWEEN